MIGNGFSIKTKERILRHKVKKLNDITNCKFCISFHFFALLKEKLGEKRKKTYFCNILYNHHETITKKIEIYDYH